MSSRLSVRSSVLLPSAAAGLLGLAVACVPKGSAPSHDAGPAPEPTSTFKPSRNVMTEPFEDDFERVDEDEGGAMLLGDASRPLVRIAEDAAADARRIRAVNEAGAIALLEAGADAARSSTARGPQHKLGPNWLPMRTDAWRIEDGRLCAQGARNRGIWLRRTLPVNARIEFDAVALSDDGDLKAEVWGSGRSYATGTSYTNATSYLTIFGGWKNSLHVLARLDEHGADRKVIRVNESSDDPREQPVVRGQVYRFKIERTDGKTIRWSIDGVEYLSWTDPEPLAGEGHDHFGFNEWEAKVCFDNVKVTPL